jgi:hypothetical protein
MREVTIRDCGVDLYFPLLPAFEAAAIHPRLVATRAKVCLQAVYKLGIRARVADEDAQLLVCHQQPPRQSRATLGRAISERAHYCGYYTQKIKGRSFQLGQVRRMIKYPSEQGAEVEGMPMLSQRMRKAVEAIERLPNEEQDKIAAAIERALEQPAIGSDIVRPEVARIIEDVIARSGAVLDYLKDR